PSSPSAPTSLDPERPPDWDTVFAAAGLDRSAFTAANPAFLPPFYADSRMAWRETKPETPGRPLRVEAAALGGRPVYFELAGPWTLPPHAGRAEPGSDRSALAAPIMFTVLLVG